MDRPGLGHHVQGEVYEVDDTMLELLDEIEDAPRYYKRKCESVRIISEPTNGKVRDLCIKNGTGPEICY